MRSDSRTFGHLPHRSTDPSLSVTTAKKEFHLSRCFFLLFSDLDRWLPHRNAINDRLPALTCHRCIGCWHTSLASAILYVSSTRLVGLWCVCGYYLYGAHTAAVMQFVKDALVFVE
ncbi:hypothetical protein MUK42_24558 [Musa troglodytarum]|uniref:Uncharacterized protein n=1 Tax=Musa troglodytarum TaxID=320322 RepID=A0A9E7JNI2_9LILI|nr:hypothetical protein MUK42_24558 [Musa troglodytarum]